MTIQLFWQKKLCEYWSIVAFARTCVVFTVVAIIISIQNNSSWFTLEIGWNAENLWFARRAAVFRNFRVLSTYFDAFICFKKVSKCCPWYFRKSSSSFLRFSSAAFLSASLFSIISNLLRNSCTSNSRSALSPERQSINRSSMSLSHKSVEQELLMQLRLSYGSSRFGVE